MDNDTFYFDVPDANKKEEVINMLLDSYINARVKAKFDTNSKGFDEDVNLYIAHLLYAISMPNYSSITEQYISLHETEVRVLADMAEDNYLKYFIFKVNADNLLVHLGIFRDLCRQAPYNKDPAKGLESFEDNAKDFYSNAAQLNKKIYRRKTAIADVLLKLSKNLPLYVKSMLYARKSFFLFLNRYEDSEFGQFLDYMKLYEQKIEFESKQNLFLDLYSRWLKKKTNVLKTKINTVCQELHELDPSFIFNLE
ncbi:MAG: hypothetical protein KKH94_08195 [Candidatus Omnitrophica bacterium]|nr:hypothetical protein [Candidatus Omnitrophota bacterium]